MKNSTILTLLTTIFLVLQLQVNAQTTYVPDDNFEQALIYLGYDSGPLDNFVPTANISQLTSLFLYNENISDLTGIEDFTALKSLECTQNQLISLDLSANTALEEFSCNLNKLTSLDMSANTALKSLYCDQNQLTSLNVKNGNNTNFTAFLATNNPNLNCITVDDANNVPSLFQNNVDADVNFNEDCSTLSASEVEISHVYIGPNPITNLLTIDLANTNTNLESAVLYDITGKIVLQTNKTTLVTTHLQSGLYILEVTTDKKILTKKLIKK